MKNIKIEKDGKVEYEGPIRRGNDYMIEDRRVVWGIFSLKDFIQLSSIIVVVTIFLIRAEAHIKVIQDTVESMTTEIKYFNKCQKQADNYHSSVTGEPFDCGQPSGIGKQLKKDEISLIKGGNS